MKKTEIVSLTVLLSLLAYCSSDEKGTKAGKQKRDAALAIMLSQTPYDPDQAAIDAVDADIVNPGPLNMNVKSVTASSSAVSLGKNYRLSASIQSDYDAKNVLIRFLFVNKSQIDAGITSDLKQFEVLDRIPYIKKGTVSYDFNLSIPDAGTSHSGSYMIYTILDPENKRDSSFQKSGMLSGVNKSGAAAVTVDSSSSGTRDLYIGSLKARDSVVILKPNQAYAKSRIGISLEAFSKNKDSENTDVEFFFADANGTKLTSLGNLLVYSSSAGTASQYFRFSTMKADQKANADLILVPSSAAALANIQNYVQANGANSLKVYAEINPTGAVSEVNSPGGATSNSAAVSVSIAADTGIKSVPLVGTIQGDGKAISSSLNTDPLREYSAGYSTGTLGDKSLFAVDMDVKAYGKILKNTTVIGHGEAKSNIYMFDIISRTLFQAYAHAELIPIRMSSSFVDAEVKAMNLSGDLAVVYKKYETGAKSYYWYTTKYKDKKIEKRIFVYGVPVKLTGVIAGILLSKNKNQLSECTINSCRPDEFNEGFSEINYKDYSVSQIHVRNNFEINVNPRILLRGFAQAKPDTGVTLGLEGQLTILDIFPVAKGTATVRMVNNAYQVEIEFKETLDVFMEYLYGKLEMFVEIPYPKISFWDASIEYYRKYWTLVSWNSLGDFKDRFLDESQFIRIHLYTGEINFTY